MRETFLEAFALGNLSFLPESCKISAHMTTFMMRSQYANMDKVAINHLVRPLNYLNSNFWSPSYPSVLCVVFSCTCMQVKLHNCHHLDDFFVFWLPVALDHFKLEFANEVAQALGLLDSAEVDLDLSYFQCIDSAVIKGQNTFLVFYQSAWIIDLIQQ